MGINDIKRLNE